MVCIVLMEKVFFNVPYNQSKCASVDEKLIMDISQVLQGVTILDGDFEDACADAQQGDFIFWTAHTRL